jgi:beta-N-acetylhexosaminidase
MGKEISGKIGKITSRLSTKEKLGQLLMLDFRYWGKNSSGEPIPFTVMNYSVSNLIKDYNLGGIAFFRENTKTPEQIVNLTSSIQETASIPLIIAIDQEGGIVTRLQTGTDMPGTMALGAINDIEMTKNIAQTIGEELKALGINMNFAPDIDVNSNPLNPIIGVRSFGSSPDLVSKHGVAYIDGLKEAGVMSSVKHFPGHGNTASDTHLGLATVNYTEKEMYDIDLKPFYSAIAAKADTVMAAHVTVPVLDDSKVISKKDGKNIDIPTTLSKKILTGLLRDEMKFDGVVVTDAMDMKAISDNFGNNEATILTILAGTDMPVMSVRVWDKEDIHKLESLIASMEKEYNNNIEFKNRVEESIVRILKLKEEFNLLEKSNSKNINTKIKIAQEIVGSEKHKSLEKEASLKAITLLKNNNTLPFKLQNDSKILLIDSNNPRMNIFSDEFISVCNRLKLNAKIDKYKINYDDSMDQKLKNKVLNSDLVIICTYNLKNCDTLPEEISHFTAQNKIKSVVIACRNPYDILHIRSCQSYLAIYGASGFDQTNYMQASLAVNIETAVRTIFYSDTRPNLFNSPKGKLPVDISTDYPLGKGLEY